MVNPSQETTEGDEKEWRTTGPEPAQAFARIPAKRRQGNVQANHQAAIENLFRVPTLSVSRKATCMILGKVSKQGIATCAFRLSRPLGSS
jgi:hypothetical protein